MKILKYILTYTMIFALLSLLSFVFAVDEEIDIDEYETYILLRDGTSYYFTIQPTNYYGLVGTNAIFNAAVNDPDATPQWQYFGRSNRWENANFDTSQSWQLVVPITEGRIGYKFRCVATLSNNQIIVSNEATIYESDTLSVSDGLYFVGNNVISKIFNFMTPWGVTFGAVVVGVFGLPLVVGAIKKFF